MHVNILMYVKAPGGEDGRRWTLKALIIIINVVEAIKE